MISWEAFSINADRLEHWAQSQSPFAQSATTFKLIELIRETIELRKTNANLVKSTLIDDLICDIYARLYETVVPELVAKSNDDENRDRMRVDHLLMNSNFQHTDIAFLEPHSLGPGEPVVRVRSKGVGRREIGRRAEALIVKPPSLLPLSKSKPTGSGPTSVPTEEKTTSVIIERGVDNREEGPKEMPSSVPGSVHDSADDESELSDIVEEEEEEEEEEEDEGQEKAESEGNVMFPGLMSRSLGDGDGETTEDDVEEDVEGEMGVEGVENTEKEAREGSVGGKEIVRDLTGVGNIGI